MGWHEQNMDKLAPLVPKYVKLIEEKSKNSNGVEIMEWVYKLIDGLTENPDFHKLISCAQGCSFCCHDQIPLTQFESDYFKHKMKGKVQPDRVLLHNQNKESDFYKLSFADKQCSLLKDGMCSVYEDRPIVCRLHNSTGDPKLCKIDENGDSGNHGQLYAVELEALHMALGLVSESQGKFLHETLKEME